VLDPGFFPSAKRNRFLDFIEDSALQAEGKMDKAKGAVHNAVGDVKEETHAAVNSRPGSGSGS
jgi:hypothetical protein